MFSLEKQRLRGDLIAVYKFLVKGSKGPGINLFLMVTRDREWSDTVSREI